MDYDTDILKAKKVMLQVAEKFPNILVVPETSVFVDKFDESSINLILRFWIDSKDEYFTMKSNVTETINLAFKQAKITIPFPQVTISNRVGK
ncbi:mechanosensitive ion channel [bacterium]|nr:mechanosensitive ion channel [bacterium]